MLIGENQKDIRELKTKTEENLKVFKQNESKIKDLQTAVDDLGVEVSNFESKSTPDSYFEKINQRFSLDSLWSNVKSLKNGKAGKSGPSIEGSQCTYTCLSRYFLSAKKWHQ